MKLTADGRRRTQTYYFSARVADGDTRISRIKDRTTKSTNRNLDRLKGGCGTLEALK